MTTSQPLPTGTVTFLFTDIEGSTRLLRQLGDRFGELLDEHHRLVREAVAEARGTEVSTEGDAFFVVFPSAPDAVRGAARIQRAFANHPWSDDITVRVRMGMHTGVGALAGDNYGGIDVHRAARIAAAAHGEQVLLSAATVALVEQLLPAGVALKELGEFHLKDLEHPERLHQLCIDGLRSDFPAPRAQQTRLTNLPPPLTTLVGRERERETVWELLRSNRLVTLTGAGGTGKTRLSMAVAERALGQFSDGVFMVLLASLEDPRLVPSTIAHTLGLR
ncbi:MAG TPA: adenylate/guanylate cyclase domain-containing protein, partial [Actinomycetota bacterium]|nr:adenylate/guanylate cyclase domain-containing protein [Actinomycetota bacterium]